MGLLLIYLYWTIEAVQVKGTPANYYSEVKDRDLEYKDEMTPSDGERESRTGDGGGSSQTADESQSYVNEDEDPSLNVHWPLTKNPAYGLPPVGILQSDHDQTADESQSYVNEDEDQSLNVNWPLTKNPAYGLPPVGILQSDHDQTADESQSYVNEDEDQSLNVNWPLTKNPAYGLPPVGILQSDCDDHDGGGSHQTADETQTYINEDGDPSLNVHCPMTKNPAYDLPPVSILQSDHVNDEGTRQ